MSGDVYDRLGVKKLINAAGTYTMVGGSRMSPKTLNTMREAAGSFVDLRELQSRVHERLAQITNNESALVVTGAAAGLYVLAAACVSLKLDRTFAYLSPSEVEQCEIVIFRAHRNPYDWSLRQLGIRLVDIGYPNMIQPTSTRDLEQAMTPHTAAVFYTAMNQGWVAEGALSLSDTVAAAARRGIPVVVDGAAQLPPVSNLWAFNQMGAAATVFSGGKDLAGPQASGLITGSRRLLDAAREIAFPNYGIGRMLKVGREEMAGLLSAVEQYVSMDHDDRARWCRDQLEVLKASFADHRNVEVVDSYPNEAGQPIARAIVRFAHEGVGSDRVIERLRTGVPGVFAIAAGENGIFVNPMTLAPGEIEMVVQRLKDVFAELGVC